MRISLRSGVSEELLGRVRDGFADIAFLGLPATEQPSGVGARELEREPLVAVTARGHPLAGESAVTLSRLAKETFVDLPAGTAGRLQSDQAFAAAGLTREVAFEVSSVEHVTQFVRRRLGIALLPAAYARGLRGLTTVEVSDAPVRVEWIVWNRQDCTPAAGAFLELLGLPAAADAPG